MAVVNTDVKKVENVRDSQRGHVPQTQQVPREEVAGMTVKECLGSSLGRNYWLRVICHRGNESH